MKYIVVTFLRLYKFLISPILEILFGHACRQRPTCSEYAIEEISLNGVIRGGKRALIRFINCNPWFELKTNLRNT